MIIYFLEFLYLGFLYISYIENYYGNNLGFEYISTIILV